MDEVKRFNPLQRAILADHWKPIVDPVALNGYGRPEGWPRPETGAVGDLPTEKGYYLKFSPVEDANYSILGFKP